MQSRRQSIISQTDENLPSIEQVEDGNGRMLNVKRQHFDPNPKGDPLWNRQRKSPDNSRRGSLNYELLVRVASAFSTYQRRSSLPLPEPATYHPPCSLIEAPTTPSNAGIDVNGQNLIKTQEAEDPFSNWKAFKIAFLITFVLVLFSLGAFLGYLLHRVYHF